MILGVVVPLKIIIKAQDVAHCATVPRKGVMQFSPIASLEEKEKKNHSKSNDV